METVNVLRESIYRKRIYQKKKKKKMKCLSASNAAIMFRLVLLLLGYVGKDLETGKLS